ncbi:LysR family transcriptional regulator [Undibacterium parvum]|uniref:LysR family transcriptional regulator n=1 Tax=Undibacterium parvum TaxID=401471 RepID=A0A3S9HQA5_9BURK|nr:LysR family transcriptional regulator [Undibacterium parvum]AZP14298.1 LysR family transcriptional regulator [Undibacterium parvum]
MDTLSGINSFVKAVESGSIASAARQLGITPAAASQNIARLEQYMGVKLLTRTTRKLSLTESGDVYYAKVSDVLHRLELARSAVDQLQGVPQGRLRIATAVTYGRHIIAPLLPAFCARYPSLSIELISTDFNVNHSNDDVDLSIRFKQQLEPHLVSRRIATIPMVICAAPSYLQRAGIPRTPEDLKEHACLLYRISFNGLLFRWTFIRDGLHFEPELRPSIISNDIDSLTQMAVAGAGIARLASFIAEPLIASGQLQALFDESSDQNDDTRVDAEPLDFHICYRDRAEVSLKMRLFIDYLLACLPHTEA